MEGRIDDRSFTAERAEWEARRADAAEETQRLTRTSAKTLDYTVKAFELANRAYDLPISREPRDQRPVLEVLLSNSVLAEGRVAVTFASPSDVLANPPSEPETENGDPGSPDRRHLVWSGWVYAYRTFWVDAGADWDEQKVAEFLELGGTGGR